MLHRAASNAYSWWWASHIRTKQSKWLEQSLRDMEEKVNATLKIIDDDGDSFTKRVEMYYRKRPELIAFVEESYKSFRSLAERYDHLSRELQSANHKIATAFPDEVQFDVDEDEEEDDISRKSGSFPGKQARDLPDEQKSRIPKVPGVPGKDFRSAASRKGQFRQIPTYDNAPPTVPSSGLSKDEALKEIDKLQKEILSLQTEKEFVKIAFERGKEKCWEIENQIMEMQQKVCCLQDEFSVSIVMEDDEARTLMATTALKSCQEALIKLQEGHQLSQEEVNVEDKKIQEAYEKFKALSGVPIARQEGQARYTEDKNFDGRYSQEIKPLSPQVNTEQREKDDLESAQEKMREEIDGMVAMPELAEKIDSLVYMVVNLEVGVSSQTAQVRGLRSETAVLQAHIHALEEEKRNSSDESSEKVTEKLKELEEELERVKNLKQHVAFQCQNLLTHFTEAAGDINNLSEKLENLDLDMEVEMTRLLQEAKVESDGKPDDREIREHKDTHVHGGDQGEEEESKDGGVPIFQDRIKSRQEELFALSGPNSDFDALSEKPQELVPRYKEESQDLFDTVTEMTNQEFAEEGEDDQPNWKKLFLNGLEDREKILLDEYTSILRSYKDVKNKLREMEKENRDGLLELSMEIRELRNANGKKEEELQALRQKLGDIPSMTTKDEPNDDCYAPPSSSMTTAPGRQPLYKLLFLHDDGFTRTMKYKEGDTNVYKIGEAPVVPTMKEKLRVEIDELLEDNLKFWLRFSTSIHQIKKFQTTFHDLRAELVMPKDAKKQKEGSSKNGSSASPTSGIRAVCKHLKEMQTEIKLWIEDNELLNEQLQTRSSTLSDIQVKISRFLEVGPSVGEDDLITEHQAAKFQGEVLNMRQENQKIEYELRLGLDRVKKLQAKIAKTLKKLDEDLSISASKKQKPNQARSSLSSRYRIPLRSFLFGAKLKKQKPSTFTCTSPEMQKQHSEMRHTELPT